MSDRNHQRAARGIQSECGLSYSTALAFVQKRWGDILLIVRKDDKVDWKEVPSAAAGLWRREHPEPAP